MKDPKPEQQKFKELLVYIIRRDSKCEECGEELMHGSFLYLEKGKPLCLACADLDHLEFLPRGDMALTLRAKKHSKIYAIVLQWSRTRKRHERQGLLVEHIAIEQAMRECLSDEKLREERRKREIKKGWNWMKSMSKNLGLRFVAFSRDAQKKRHTQLLNIPARNIAAELVDPQWQNNLIQTQFCLP